MNINQKIFKTYDVRGIYPLELNEEVFYTIGKVFSDYLLNKQKIQQNEMPKIVVGQDVRLSSPSLAGSFIRGVLDSGLDVLDIGVVTTPMLYFAVIEARAFGGAIMTASHNPPEYNGIKFVRQMSEFIGGEEIQELYRMCVNPDSLKIFGNGKGKREKKDFASGYLDLVAKGFNARRKMKIVIDASCGTTALFLPRFLDKLKIDYVPLFFEPDGSFCNHDPNPLAESAQKFAKEKISEEKADFGVVFDGDGDRAVFIDENSNVFGGDVSGGIIAGGLLKAGDKIAYPLTSTRALRDYFGKKEVKTRMTKVGRFYIHKEMRENDVDFCSEMSGHFFFKSLHYTDSAFYALRLIIEALDKNPESKLSDLAGPFLKYFNSGEINLCLSSSGEWQKILAVMKKHFKDGRQNFKDGILVEYDEPSGGINWWFNIRPSNTEPIVRLVVEAKTKELFEEKKKEILRLLN